MKKILICTLLNCIFCSCPESFGDEYVVINEKVRVINDSDEMIYIEWHFGEFEYLYPFYSLEDISPLEPSDNIDIEIGYYPDGTFDHTKHALQIMILRQSTLNKYSIQEIEDKHIVDKRYILIVDRVIKDGGMIISYKN